MASFLYVLFVSIFATLGAVQGISSVSMEDSSVNSYKSVKRVKRSIEMNEMNLTQYMATCGSVIDLDEGDAIITTPSSKHGKYVTGIKCTWTVVGNHYCRPLLECEDFDLRLYSKAQYTFDRCKEEYLEVTDGLGGHNFACDRNSFQNPILPSKPAYDLYFELKTSPKTEFERNYRGINCTVSCRRKHPNILPTRLVPRGFKRRTQPNCTCGRRRPQHNSTIDQYPWHVAVVRKNTSSLRCSGTLINNFYVLTSASCLLNSQGALLSRNKIDILAGVNDLVRIQEPKREKRSPKKGSEGHVHGKSHDKGHHRSLGHHPKQKHGHIDSRSLGNPEPSHPPLRIAVSKVIPHEGFNPETLDFDIALLRLWKPLDFAEENKDLTTVCLPPHLDSEHQLGEKYLTSVGWSLTDDHNPPNTRVLHKVFIPALVNKKCEKDLKRELNDRMFCAGFDRPGVEGCVVEAGSPLIDDNRGKDNDGTQIGIASYTDGCGDGTGQLAVYTKLSVYMQWIYHHTYDARWCNAKRGQL